MVEIMTPSIGKSSIPMSARGQSTMNEITSKKSTRSSTFEQPALVSVRGRSPHTISVHQEPALESEAPRSPTISGALTRTDSPAPTLHCDGFGLCDNYTAEVPRVVDHSSLIF